MKKKTRMIIDILVILIGAAFVFSAITYWMDIKTTTDPKGVGENLREW